MFYACTCNICYIYTCKYKSSEYDAVTSTSALESPASSTSDLVYNPINRSTLSSENLTDINTDTPLFPGSLPSIKTKLGKIKVISKKWLLGTE